MIKNAISSSGYERVFIREALATAAGIRLDGRGVHDYREISLKLERFEHCCTAEVQWGQGTFVICSVSGEVVCPYADRPTEGILKFNAEVSDRSENHGTSNWEIVRMLEHAIKESEALDTESLCIIANESVWQINCEVRVLDGNGGNILDASMFAAMAGLRAFRKPDVSLVTIEEKDELQSGDGGGHQRIFMHHSNDREPLPLSLQHTPLFVTLGLFNLTQKQSTNSVNGNNMIIICDLSANEEDALDGIISFSINGHNELCSINKPAGLGLTTKMISAAAALADRMAMTLHQKLKSALDALEEDVLQQREVELEKMKKYNALQQQQEQQSINQMEEVVAGVDRNDPILDWTRLHQPAGLSNEAK